MDSIPGGKQHDLAFSYLFKSRITPPGRSLDISKSKEIGV